MGRILDMISTWPHLGQGIFFFFIAALILGCIRRLVFYITCMIQGWPPEFEEEEKEEIEQV